MKAEFSEVFELPLGEKLQLLEHLWDSIASDPDQVPVTEWQKEELQRRKENYLNNPGSAISWDGARERIRKRHG